MEDRNPTAVALEKAPTGIDGFDEITGGGLPKGRPTLVCGGAGCGKTLFAMEFLVRGAVQFGEPGVFVAFEENEGELAANMASIGWDLEKLAEEERLYLDHVHIERSEIEEAGEFNLEGLFIRIESGIRAVGAQRIVIDTIETLFGGFSDQGILRSEIRRLFRWLKEKGLTAVITGEAGNGTLTRQGLEEYVSDCVIFLDHRMAAQMATRRLRVIKYRGSSHGTNEYPFLITEKGLSVLPVTSLGLDYPVSDQRVSTGIPRLDTMLGGRGFYRGSSVLVSGTAGTGKSSLAATFLAAACRRGERSLYFSFEEAPQQLVRNMRSISIDLQSPVEAGLLKFHSMRVTSFGLEMHLAMMLKAVADFKPRVVAVDPVSNLISVSGMKDVKETLVRLIDSMKMKGVTTLFTDLSHGGTPLESTETAISSLMDTWILLRDIESNGERNRGVYVLKSRGMAHSHQIREFLITGEGVDLIDVYIGPGGVLTGTARVNKEAEERAARKARKAKARELEEELRRKRVKLQNRVAELESDFQAEKDRVEQALKRMEEEEKALESNLELMATLRGKD